MTPAARRSSAPSWSTWKRLGCIPGTAPAWCRRRRSGRRLWRSSRRHTRAIADALEVKGPLNVQFAVQRDPAGQPQVFVIEANPRASRTVPFVSKATGVPLAKVAARVMAGATLASLRAEGLLRPPVTGYVSVKEAVLPFDRFPDADSLLGPEMRSTGEVMGIDRTFGLAFAKSQLAAGDNLADGGTVFFSVADRDKPAGLEAAARFVAAGFTIAATSGTAEYLEKAGVPVGTIVGKVTADAGRGSRGSPAAVGEAVDAVDAVELIRSGKVQLVVNTPGAAGLGLTAHGYGGLPTSTRSPCSPRWPPPEQLRRESWSGPSSPSRSSPSRSTTVGRPRRTRGSRGWRLTPPFRRSRGRLRGMATLDRHGRTGGRIGPAQPGHDRLGDRRPRR